MLETLPGEFTVVDENDKIVAWNKHEGRLFKRSMSVLGEDVKECHSKKSLDMVSAILSEMRLGKREAATFWSDEHGVGGTRKLLTEYRALRGRNGEYLGCLETTQDITDIQGLRGEKRLLD